VLSHEGPGRLAQPGLGDQFLDQLGVRGSQPDPDAGQLLAPPEQLHRLGVLLRQRLGQLVGDEDVDDVLAGRDGREDLRPDPERGQVEVWLLGRAGQMSSVPVVWTTASVA